MMNRAVVFCVDRNTRSTFLTRKNRRSNSFSFRGCTYTLDDNSFMITKAWRWSWKWNTVTYYYRENDPTPLPLPLIDQIPKQGLEGAAVERLFNPWALKILGKARKQGTDLNFWFHIATMAGIGYLIYLINGIRNSLAGLGIS